MEQTLGHVTHTQNLRRLLPSTELDIRVLPIEFEPNERWKRLPGHQNWTLRAGVRARSAIRKAQGDGGRPDVMFVHTQVPAVLLGREMREVPTVVSLDATPRQYDELGAHYAHDVGHPRVEAVKATLNRRCFERAAHLVTWADWTKSSLIDDYGVDADRITVIPPGVDVAKWSRPDGTSGEGDGVTRILFVGGNLERKGGTDLLAAFSQLRAVHGDRIELHLVTPTLMPPAQGVSLYDSMTPNSAELIELYHRCHIFCLPTLGDCLPMVLPEAAAAGLALVSTDVGAISEIVRHEQTGLLVQPRAVAELVSAIDRLVTDPSMRRRLAEAGSLAVRDAHDALRNATRLAQLLCDVADVRTVPS